MKLSVAAAAGERADIADDGAFTVAAGMACWIVRLLLPLQLYLGDRPTRDCFPRPGLDSDAADIFTFPGGRRGHCISLQSEQGVDSRSGTYDTRMH